MGENQDSSSSFPDSKASYVLSNVAEVIERILTFVPTKSLVRIASVCRLWRNCARRVLRSQQRLTWVSAQGAAVSEGHVLYDTLAQEVERVFLLPKTVLVMADCEAFNEEVPCRKSKAPKRIRYTFDTIEKLNRFFPKGCDVMGVATPGIVLTPHSSRSSAPQEYQEGEAGYALMFPSMDGVHIKPFHFCKNTMSPTALKEAGLVDNPELRVVMIFVYDAYTSGGARFLHQLLEPLAKTKAVIAGGLVDRVVGPPRHCCNEGAYGVVGLALSGPRVQGASVVLDEDVHSPSMAESSIRQLKEAQIPEKNTLGFMFACVGRGQNFYDNKRNVEADAFRKVFPNIPLFGLFGNGEIGCDRIIKEGYALFDANANSLQHQYTTVMTLVHFG